MASSEIGELRKLKVVELRDKLSNLKLPTAGLKAELVERLHKYYKENGGNRQGDGDAELRFPPPPPNIKFGSPPGGSLPPSLMNISTRPTSTGGTRPLPPHQQGPPQITKAEPPQKTALQLRLAQMAGMQTEKLEGKKETKKTDHPPLSVGKADRPPPSTSKVDRQPPPMSKADRPTPPMSKPSEQAPPRSQPPPLMSQHPQRPHHPPPHEKQPQHGHPPQKETPPQMDHPPQIGKPPQPPHLMLKQPPQQPPQQPQPLPQIRPQQPPPQIRPQQQQPPPQIRPPAPQQQQPPPQIRPQQQQPPPQMRPQAPQQQQTPPQMMPQQQQPPPQMRPPAPQQQQPPPQLMQQKPQQPPPLMSQTPQPTTQVLQQATSQPPPLQQPPSMSQAPPSMQPPPPGIQPPGVPPPPGIQPPGLQPSGVEPLPGVQPPGLQPPPGVQPPGLQPPGVPPPPGMQPPGLQPPGVQPPPGIQTSGPPQQVFQQAPQINQQVIMEKELQEKVAMQTRLLEQERQNEQQRALDQQRHIEQQQKERLAIQQQAMLMQQQKQGPPMGSEEPATGEQFMERVRQQQIMLEEKDRMEQQQQQQVMMEQQTAAMKQQDEDRRRKEAELLRQQQMAMAEAQRDEQQQRGPPPREMEPPNSSGPGYTPPGVPHGAPVGMRPPGPRPMIPPPPHQMVSRPSIPPLMSSRSTAASSIPPLMPPGGSQNQIRPPPSLRPRPGDGDGPQKQFGPTDELKEPRGMKLPSALEKVLAFKDARAQEVGMTPEELEKLNEPEVPEKPMEEEQEWEDEIETVEMEGMDDDDDQEETTPQQQSKESKNKRRKKKKKKAKKNRLQKQIEEEYKTAPPRPPATTPDVTIEYVQEQLDLDPTDPNYFTFSKIFEAFKIAEDVPKELPKAVEKPKKDDVPKVKDLDDDDDSDSDEADKEHDDRPKLSKKKLKKLTRLSVAQLKQLVSRPDVVEMHDVTAQDPRLLVSLKATRNTVTVPRHWCFKRKYLQGKRGIEKAPFELPDYIQATGITEMRQALAEKEDQQTLKSKMREKVRPKMGKIDIDYQKLHDAFFRWQVKPKMTIHGDLYYEGKEFETRLKEKKPGNLSDDLKTALGMPIGPQSEKVPPPWLIAMQRYGPPPSYPNLRIPGLNGPIPETCSFGYHAGGWGKPPVDENGKPLYGDVFGTKGSEFETEVQEEAIDKSHWGEVESESESEEESSDESEAEAIEDSGLITPAEGLATPSGITSIPVGMETPDMIELRKQRIENAMDEGGDTPALYQVLPEKKTAVGAAMMGSAHVYDVTAVPAPAPKKPGEKVSTEGIEVALNPEELDLDTAAMQAKYDQTMREQQSQLEKEDLSDMVAEHAAKQKKRKKKQEESGKATKKYKEFKF